MYACEVICKDSRYQANKPPVKCLQLRPLSECGVEAARGWGRVELNIKNIKWTD